MQSQPKFTTNYTFEEFHTEASAYVKAMWQNENAIDGVSVIECQLQQATDNPFLPKEYQIQLKLTARRQKDGLVFKMSVMYSITNQLPELFFTCYEETEEADGDRVQTMVDDIDRVVLAAGFKGKTIEEKMFIVTQKEHPIDNMVVWSVHECRIKELMPAFTSEGNDTKPNIFLQWLSIVIPSTLGIDGLTPIDVVKQILGGQSE